MARLPRDLQFGRFHRISFYVAENQKTQNSQGYYWGHGFPTIVNPQAPLFVMSFVQGS
jgi:hypothetical protein